MNTEALERSFAKMGARVKIDDGRSSGVSLNVLRDRDGEYFSVFHSGDVQLEVLDVEPKDRHLVLMSREGREKHRYLLGHDERHWFVAGIPEATSVTRVRDAKQALRPDEVRVRESGVRVKARERRRNSGWVRQGEWFFVPRPGMVVEESKILRNEPLRRSNSSKSHMCDELYRSGGELVYVSHRHREGLTEAQYAALTEKERKSLTWQRMQRNPSVWVRGKVRHADHATIVLGFWHEVFMNTENKSMAMARVAFLD